MKSRMLYAVLVVTMTVVQASPVMARGHSSVESGLATFEGEAIDLRDGWGRAKACVVWDSDAVVECFRSEGELVERIAAAEQSILVSDGLLAGASTCSSSLRLYDGTSYTGSALYLYQRTSWINLSNYGWSNRTSSFKVGACLSYFADYANGGGNWYPTSSTQAWDQSAAMISGWNNRVSSIYIG